MPSLKQILSRYRKEPFDQLCETLQREGKKEIGIVWNRGMGDIPLSMYAATLRLKAKVPGAKVTYLTRKGLLEPFSLLPGAASVHAFDGGRGSDLSTIDWHQFGPFDHVIEHLDIKYNFLWQINKLIPHLDWKEELDHLAEPFGLPERCIGIHMETETDQFYDRDRSFSIPVWEEIFTHLIDEMGYHVVLFGAQPKEAQSRPGLIDLRGKTRFLELMAIIKNKLSVLIAPDSGVLCCAYYLNAQFPLKVVSIWGATNQGILKQGVISPNRQLTHIALKGEEQNVHAISKQQLYEAIDDR
ncbi:MAG: hypothetical protein S4CHLAM102_08890 [Chlamydiia bacterium]|nr:hypothetical protein [Chlamydiia bacterium]